MNHTAYTDDVWSLDDEGKWIYFNEATGIASFYDSHEEAAHAKANIEHVQKMEEHAQKVREAEDLRFAFDRGDTLTCTDCDRTYSNDHKQHTSAWRGHVFCSQYCESGHGDRLRRSTVGTDFKADGENPFDWLLARAEQVYTKLLGEHHSAAKHDLEPEGIYWRGHTWDQVSPFQFASAFLDQAMQNMYMSDDERSQFMERLCESANFVRYGAPA